MGRKTKPLTVQVSGDITLDWNFARIGQIQGNAPNWNTKDNINLFWQCGGASLLADLVSAVGSVAQESNTIPVIVQRPETPKTLAEASIGDPSYHHSFAIWAEKKYASSPQATKKKVWRVDEYLGTHHAENSRLSMNIADDNGEADVVVLDDANLGFREAKEYWPKTLKETGKSRPWVILQTTQPVAQGALWNHLINSFADRLIVVLSANDLRLSEIQISHGLSWERTAQDVVWELLHNPRVSDLARCAHTVLSFGPEGAILLSNQVLENNNASTSSSQSLLFFDPQTIEGSWEHGYPGGMIGRTICLTAGIVYQVMRSTKAPDIGQGIHSGLSAMRLLHQEGYQALSDKNGQQLAFPMEQIATEIAHEDNTLAEIDVKDPVQELNQPHFWTILHDHHRYDLDRVAEQIVLEGIEKALPDVPYGRFGYLVTVDRQEIESFRTICTLVDEYLKQDRPKRPLSMGVFGAPGSGKSFGITQVANSLAPGRIEKLEFNLSQMNSSVELPDALHQVRDVILQGKIPLVFWDEFDTSLADKPLGWLGYFLAPMQDGAFREGQLTHPIGRSIFVFAGGTSHTMEGFGKGLTKEESRAAKVPDFISRLKGYVNVLGPNPRKDEDDPYYIIRRAILLRSMLQRENPDLFQNQKGKKTLAIDSGVLRAFLRVSKYKHGVRSMETIITMSQLSDKSSLARSSLPPESQLNLHVNGQEFLALVQQIQFEGEVLEKLARAHHEFFRKMMTTKGYRVGPKTDEQQKTHSSLVSWEQLPEDEKEQNRTVVRDIPNKLNQIGYVMIPARSNKMPEFPKGKDDLERLSKIEHERWVQTKLSFGWKYAPETQKERKLHKSLLPWDDQRLSEDEKDKDRDLVRDIPALLAMIGYTVVDLDNDDAAGVS